MIIKYESCRHCASINLVKNGKTNEGSQRYKCKDCGRQSRDEYKPKHSEEKKEEILRSYHEKSSLRGLKRVYGVSPETVKSWLKKKAQTLPCLPRTLLPAKRDDTLELDELWSFVDRKQHKCWIWLALCRRTRQSVGLACGDRGLLTCNRL